VWLCATPVCVSVCVCLCVFCRRVIGGVVALLPAAADAAPGHRPTALAPRLLCLVNLGRAHCHHTATHGGTLGLPTHTAPSLVSHLLDAAHCYRQWRNYNFWAPPPANIRYGPQSTFEPLMPVRLHCKMCQCTVYAILTVRLLHYHHIGTCTYRPVRNSKVSRQG